MSRLSNFVKKPANVAIFAALVITLSLLALSFWLGLFSSTTQLKIGSGVYHVRMADTEDELEKGLSGVKKLDNDEGLLMKFSSDNTWGIWMKDMLIPLDIIWLDSDKKVVHIVENAKPELSTSVTYFPKQLSRYVIEIPSGSVKRFGIKTGQVAEFNEHKLERGWLWFQL